MDLASDVRDTMSLEKTIRDAYAESVNGTRKGDRSDELDRIRSYIRSCQKICIPNHDEKKVGPINGVLVRYGICQGTHLKIQTDACDLSRMPAMTKALMALDITDSDLVIARGRLGVPGSGSLLVILDQKGRLLTASVSPPHILHGKSIPDAVSAEMESALVRIGFKPVHGGA